MSTVQLKRSATANKVPTTTDLALGELAINTNDGRLYFKKDSGTQSVITVATTDDTQTFTNKTLAAPVITGTPVETVYTITGTTPALNPTNGSIQIWTLTASSTPSDSLSAGQAITLMIDDGAGYTISWPSVTWVNNAKTAPTLATTGYTTVALWKVSTTLYGAVVGNGT